MQCQISFCRQIVTNVSRHMSMLPSPLRTHTGRFGCASVIPMAKSAACPMALPTE